MLAVNLQCHYDLSLSLPFPSLALVSQVMVHVFVSPTHVNVTELHYQDSPILVKAQPPLMVLVEAVNAIQTIAIVQTSLW